MRTFAPEGDLRAGHNGSLHLLHGTLPHEVVCTENLTPFLKLLPCKGKAGISTLLDGHKLFDAAWQTMALDMRPLCDGDSNESCVIQLEQTVDMVLDFERSKRPRGRILTSMSTLGERLRRCMINLMSLASLRILIYASFILV